MFSSIRFAFLIAGLSLALTIAAQPAPSDVDESAMQDQAEPDQYGSDQAPPDQAREVDPPTRVARISFLRGAVSFVPAGENEWVEAQMNRPLITGDKLWTDNASRAEMEIGAAAIRIDQQTSFDFLNLDDNVAQIELTQGSLNLRVRRLYDEQSYEIDTPTLAFVIHRVGEYRIDVAANGQSTLVSVLHGSGDAYGEAGARFRVEEGQSVSFNDPTLRNYVSNNLSPPDDFDNFSLQSDSRWDRSPSREYVSEDVIGYQDLDDNGDWQDEPEYGHVWYPTTVALGWSPYQHGHWGWVGAYGWTWIDEAPWGFAPFHYGRWAFVRNRWGWCPGPVAVRPVYAPALVAFIGGGVGVSVGGPVGWFPLGPRDVYFPGYRVSRNYFTTVNFSNTRVIDRGVVNNYYGGYARGNIDYSRVSYMNRNVANAVVAVPANVFTGARPVAGATIAVTTHTFANARVAGFAAIAPTRASLAFAGQRPAIAAPATAINRNVVAATRPPAPVASFAQRQTLLQKNPGIALNTGQLRVNPAQTPIRPAGAESASAVTRHNVNVVTGNNGQPSHAASAAQVTSAAQASAAAQGHTPQQAGGPQRTRMDSSRFAHPENAANDTPTAQSSQVTTAPQNGHVQSSLEHSRAPNTTGNAQNAVAGQPANRPYPQTYTNPNTVSGAASNGAASGQVGRQPDYRAARSSDESGVPRRARILDNANGGPQYNTQNNPQQQQMRVAPNNTVQQMPQRPVEVPRGPVQQVPQGRERPAPAAKGDNKPSDDDKKHNH